MTRLDDVRNEIDELLTDGDRMKLDLSLSESGHGVDAAELKKYRKVVPAGYLREHYQTWYTRTLDVIRQLAPARLAEFEALYRRDVRRKQVDLLTYTLEDWFQGIRSTDDIYGKRHFDDHAIALARISMQVDLLKAARAQLDSSLRNLREIVEADLLDSEIEEARVLLKAGYLRGAGAVAGVALEHHLATIASNHQVKIGARPTISTYNDALKGANVISQADWRFIQRLADLRNLCDHKGTEEPTKHDITDLIDGVDRVLKTVF